MRKWFPVNEPSRLVPMLRRSGATAVNAATPVTNRRHSGEYAVFDMLIPAQTFLLLQACAAALGLAAEVVR